MAVVLQLPSLSQGHSAPYHPSASSVTNLSTMHSSNDSQP
jgi:hypothetical protein